MSARVADRRLNLAFLLALCLHAAALATASRMPLPRPDPGDALARVRVFSSKAPVAFAPVQLVVWPAAVEVARGDEPEASAQEASETSSPPPRPRQPEQLRAERPRPAHAAPAAPPTSAAAPRRPAEATSVRPAGGGGGEVDLGAPSPAGDLPGPPSWGAPVGELPGVGEGSGAGVGAGSEGGAGGGEAAGTGGSEESAGRPGEGDEGFASRVADRAEPEVISRGRLTYPAGAAADGVEGRVKLKVLVTERGDVEAVEIVSSSGDRRLDAAAREWVARWRYRPAVQDGKPRRVYTYATVEFELR